MSKPIITSRSKTINVVSRAYLDTFAKIGQAETSTQFFKLDCSEADKTACWKCLQEMHNNPHVDNNQVTPSDVGEACRAVCVCDIAKLNMQQQMTVDFSSSIENSKEIQKKFTQNVLKNLAISAQNSGGKVFSKACSADTLKEQKKRRKEAAKKRKSSTDKGGDGDDTGGDTDDSDDDCSDYQQNTIWKSTKNILSQMRSNNFQSKMQSAMAQQQIVLKGGSMIAKGIRLNQTTKIVESALTQLIDEHKNTELQQAINQLQLEMIQLTEAAVDAGAERTIQWTVVLFSTTVIMIISAVVIMLLVLNVLKLRN